MQRTTGGRGDVTTDAGLPVAPETAERLALSADAPPQPPGGSRTVRAAAAGHWERRGLATAAEQVLMAPGPAPLLLALLAVTGGDLVLTRPTAAWYAPQAELLGRRVHRVAAPAECGGVPDPVALLEAVRRARADGSPGPRVVVLSVADDPTGTVAPPELVHEVCEAAAEADLLIVSDETFRDVLHAPLTVVLSPAESLPGRTVVLTDLAAGALPSGWPAAVARFPANGPVAALRDPVCDVLARLGAVIVTPVAEAAALALTEPGPLRLRRTSANRLHGAVARAAHDALLEAGALCLPPACGFHLYADFAPLRPALAAHGVTGPDELARLLPGAAPGHRFGDDPRAPRVRIAVPVMYGDNPEQREAAAAATDPLRVPHVASALAALGRAFTELTAA
ncbi:aminotransferase class I/II-fold pyridoxal phosphate-dependent enzyme [Streptomyces sp. ICBB 8177]|uniref:aminotransferase class I/II-fold pyridoxal phosphate-dependent enzyme n=1 Tax=Streptomyces sp. ICBB 8177 TaxID=563922 RepID=UPI000D67A3A3|nr:aminotransferase class I/II-fold pyridoxal phosphate-dependent enzyme [Streptomyces sp. ICBB 8177]PWI41528.1 aminopeptidase [Streptomyces sp. ICBB 8177]